VSAESARTMGDAARQVAFDAAQSAATSLSNMTVSASTVTVGGNATATVSDVSGHKHIAFGLPEGVAGVQGIQGVKGDTGAMGTPGMPICAMTRAEYDALGVPDGNTLYVITG
ncbi:MAG: hypothetical protein RR482_09445, partial [Clostridia bacterium]